MKAFLALIRREYWENRGGFVITPIVIGSLLLLASLAMLIGVSLMDHEIYVDGEKVYGILEGVRQLADEPFLHRSLGLTTFVYAIGSMFSWAMMFVLFFYFLGSLWDDRKDRSILFWKSLPVTDLKTVLSKIATGLLLVPAITLAGIAITHLLFFLCFTLIAWFAGVPAWDTFWAPAQPWNAWANLIVAMLIHGLWMFPVWGWLMLASAAARGFFRPFLIAVLIPLMIGLIDLWFSVFGRWQSLLFGEDFRSTVFPVIGERFAGGALPLVVVEGNDQAIYWNNMATGGDLNTMSLGLSAERLTEPALWWGLAFGVACVAIATYLRRYRDES